MESEFFYCVNWLFIINNYKNYNWLYKQFNRADNRTCIIQSLLRLLLICIFRLLPFFQPGSSGNRCLAVMEKDRCLPISLSQSEESSFLIGYQHFSTCEEEEA